MNRLANFRVSAQLPKLEFIDIVSAYPSDSLNALRQALFIEWSTLDVIPEDLRGIPLVSRRDSALRSLSKVLSEDCWIICDCISNNAPIPRTLLKNGKKHRSFVANQPRLALPTPSMYPPDSPSRANFSNHPVCQPTQTYSTNQPDPPSRANFSNHPVGQFTQTSSTNPPDLPSHANWGRRREQRREMGLHTTEEQDHEEESDSSEEPVNDPVNRDEFSNHSISQFTRTSSMNPPIPPSRADISNRLIAIENSLQLGMTSLT